MNECQSPPPSPTSNPPLSGAAQARFDVPIRAAVLCGWGDRPGDACLAAIRACLTPQDTLVPTTPEQLAAGAFDVVFVTQICGVSALPPTIAAAGLPALCLESHRGFHPYHAAFNHELRERGGTLLPAMLPEESAAAIRAVRSRRALRGMKLLVAEPLGDGRRQAQLRSFAAGCRERLGIEIVIRDTAELRERAAAYSDAAADAELARWYAEVMEGPSELPPAYMQQAAKLYLAEKAMLTETGAVGLTPQDIGGFLTIPKPTVMPNITYGPLAFDGYLVCEEGDVEVLATELLLFAALGRRPTMSNLYFAFRDRFGALATHKDYTDELRLADCRQCFADHRVTACHFSTAGVIPPGMMVEARYRVRETLPDWPGQGMIWATPKLGPVVVARVDEGAARVHLEFAAADGVGFGDQYGWYRGRWFIRLRDARDFAARSLHHHYAIAPDPGDHLTLETLLYPLLRLARV